MTFIKMVSYCFDSVKLIYGQNNMQVSEQEKSFRVFFVCFFSQGKEMAKTFFCFFKAGQCVEAQIIYLKGKQCSCGTSRKHKYFQLIYNYLKLPVSWILQLLFKNFPKIVEINLFFFPFCPFQMKTLQLGVQKEQTESGGSICSCSLQFSFFVWVSWNAAVASHLFASHLYLTIFTHPFRYKKKRKIKWKPINFPTFLGWFPSISF